MKIVSWDVGIYNLSYCILEQIDINEHPKIIEWDIVNLVDNEKMKKNANLLFENIPRKLYELPQLLDVDMVVIENQPSLTNPRMKSIQMILYSYFLILGKTIGNEITKSYIDKIDLCSASNKLKVYNGPKINLDNLKGKGKKNKKIIEDVTINTNNNIINNYIDNNNQEDYITETEDEEDQNKKSKTKTKEPKLKYADKKRLAIEHARYFIEKYNNEYMTFFNSHKKKDDLSDSYLQGIYYLQQNNKSKLKK